MNPRLHALLRDGVVAARHHLELARALNACACRGEVVRLLPGVYALPANLTLETQLAAIRDYGTHQLVITRRSAAALTWWPELGLPRKLEVAGPNEITLETSFTFEQRHIRAELLVRRSGVAFTTPELTVLDLVPELGARVIDEALRRRAITLPRLRRALQLTPNRRGNRLRRELIADSRDEPWSELEREAHRLLRAAGVTGWKSNHAVDIEGQRFYLDIAIPELRLAIELDGEQHHGTQDAFHRDRGRDRALARAGWLVLRFTAQSLDELVETTLEVAATRRRRLRAEAA